MRLLIESWLAAVAGFPTEPTFGEPLLYPGEPQGKSMALSLQPSSKFRHERTHHRRVRAGHVRDHENQALRVFLGNSTI